MDQWMKGAVGMTICGDGGGGGSCCWLGKEWTTCIRVGGGSEYDGGGYVLITRITTWPCLLLSLQLEPSPPSKSRFSFTQMFVTSHKQKNNDVHKLFSVVPETEKLIDGEISHCTHPVCVIDGPVLLMVLYC